MYTPDLERLLPAIEVSAIRAQGAGGQNVNKVSSAIHLRFHINNADIPQYVKDKLLSERDSRVTRDGILIIKSQNNRTQEMNKQAAFRRLLDIISHAGLQKKVRRPTKPSKSSQRKRLDSKKRSGMQKALRGKIDV